MSTLLRDALLRAWELGKQHQRQTDALLPGVLATETQFLVMLGEICEQFQPLTIKEQAAALIQAASAAGMVVTIELLPSQPLAMGNYEMVADVRPARGGA